MKEAISNTFIFNIIIVFVGVISLLLVSSISYTRAFKVKNKIVDIIENHRSYTLAVTDIDTSLKEMGYPLKKKTFSCPAIKVGDKKTISNISTSQYKYCVYEGQTSKGRYYIVKAYINFEFPLIGEVLSFPVSGETKIFYDIRG